MKNKHFLCITFIMVFLCLLISGCSAELNSSYSGAVIAAEDFAVKIDWKLTELFNENHDNYAAYFNEEEFEKMTESYYGEYGGIGIYMIKEEGADYPLVLGTMHGSPAELSGVLPGDKIVAINGESTLKMDLDIVATKVKGEQGTDVTMGFLREEDEQEVPLEISITRDNIITDSLTGSYLPEYPGIGYIAIFSFTENTPGEFRDAMAELMNQQNLNGLIIDLRNNGGGSLGASLTLASYFVNSGDVIIWQKKTDGLHSDLSDDGRWNQLPVVILQNGGTASASEVFTGALEDYQISSSVGELSFGKGITQTMYALPSGAAVRFTESRYYTPNKFDLHGVGLEPDFEVKSAEDFYPDPYNPDTSIDVQLAKAFDVMNQKLTNEAN